MPDPRSVMQEFRTLDAKRLAKGLSPEEERRHAELRDLVGGAAAGAPRGGFDVNAAAERLRESLLPAGLRNRPPPRPELSPEPEPEPFFPAPAAPAEVAFDAPLPEAPEGQPSLDDGALAADLFDPALLGWEGEPGAAPPNDPGALGGAWDPNAGWDPNAVPQDPGAWDPGAVAADPSAQAWDPNALPVDGPPWDPNAAALDPAAAQPWDPNAVPADVAGQQPWDPNAAAWDPAAAGAFEAGGAAGWDPSAYADPGAAGHWDPNAYPADAGSIELSALGEPAGTFDPAALAGEEGAQAAPLAAEPAPDAPEPTLALDLGAAGGELPALDLDAAALDLEPLDDAPFELAAAPDDALAGLVDPAALDAAVAPEPTELLGLAAEPEPTITMPLAGDAAPLPPAGWDPTPGPEQASEGAAFGAYDELASGAAPAFGDGTDTLAADDTGLDPALGLDPSAPPPVFAPAAGELGGEYDDVAGFGAAAAFAPSEGGGFETGQPHALAPSGAGDWHADSALEEGFALASSGSFESNDPTAGWATAEAPAPWEPAPGAGAPAGRSVDAGGVPPDADPVTESHSLAAAADDLALPEIVEELPTIDGAEILEEIPADEADTPPPSLDFGALPPALAPPALAPPAVAPAPTVAPARSAPPDPRALAPAAPAAFVPAARAAAPAAPPPPPAVAVARSAPPPAPTVASAPARPVAAPAPAPAAVPTAAPVAPTRAAGSHRVVVHTIEGTVKRGVIEDADLGAPVLALAPAPGAAAEQVATEKVKAIFFMLAPGEAPPAAEGKKVRVTFRDGRQVAGYSPAYREDGPGFFMIPGDARTNTGRIWVYRAAAKEVSLS